MCASSLVPAVTARRGLAPCRATVLGAHMLPPHLRSRGLPRVWSAHLGPTFLASALHTSSYKLQPRKDCLSPWKEVEVAACGRGEELSSSSELAECE